MPSSSNNSRTELKKPPQLNNQFTSNRLQDTRSLHQTVEIQLKNRVSCWPKTRIFTISKPCLQWSKLRPRIEVSRETAKIRANVKSIGIPWSQTYMMTSSLKRYLRNRQVAPNIQIATKSPFKRTPQRVKNIKECLRLRTETTWQSTAREMINTATQELQSTQQRLTTMIE